MKQIPSKNKLFLLKTASLLLGLSISGMSHAAEISPKSGSFNYLIPEDGVSSKCPSPYTPLTIVLNNLTDPTGFNPNRLSSVASAVWVNIYYVGFDDRPYYGDYVGYNAEKNTNSFPVEVIGGNPYEYHQSTATKGNDRSGPILASTAYASSSAVLGGSYPMKSWTFNAGGLAPNGFENVEVNSGGGISSGTRYDQLVGDTAHFGKYTKVFTIDNIPNNTSLAQMDGNWSDLHLNDNVTLPMRSFSRIRIEVRVGLTSKPLDMTVKTEYAPSEVIARWEAHAVSNKNGYMLYVDKSWVKTNSSGIDSSGTGISTGFADGLMQAGNTINILPADAIVITMKGTWKYSKIDPKNDLPISDFFKGSKITLSPLKMRNVTSVDGRPVSSVSGQPLVTCD